MTEIGLCLESTPLALYTNRDFKGGFVNVDEGQFSGAPVVNSSQLADFPAGTLYIELQIADDGGNPVTTWEFTISGPVATLKVESTEADRIPRRTKWQLVFLPAGEAAGGDPIAYGTVKKVG